MMLQHHYTVTSCHGWSRAGTRIKTTAREKKTTFAKVETGFDLPSGFWKQTNTFTTLLFEFDIDVDKDVSQTIYLDVLNYVTDTTNATTTANTSTVYTYIYIVVIVFYQIIDILKQILHISNLIIYSTR